MEKTFAIKWTILSEKRVKEAHAKLRALEIGSVNDTDEIYEQAAEVVLHMDSWQLAFGTPEVCVQFNDVGLSFAGYETTFRSSKSCFCNRVPCTCPEE